MAETNWDNLGEEITRIINDAVTEKNYSSLNETINRVLNDAVDSGSDALKSILNSAFGSGTDKPGTFSYDRSGAPRASETRARQPVKKTEKKKARYASVNRPLLRSFGAIAGGGILTLTALGRLLMHGFTGSLFGLITALLVGGLVACVR